MIAAASSAAWTVGRAGAKKSASSTASAKHRQADAQSDDPRLRVFVDDGWHDLGVDIGRQQRFLEVVVGDERDAAGELDRGLRAQLLRHGRIFLDALKERRGQAGDEDRTDQGGAYRRAQVRPGVLQAADLAALLVWDRRHRDGSELGGERADPEPGEQHRTGRDLGADAQLERRDERDDAGEQSQQPALDHAARRRMGQELGDGDGGEQQGDGQWEEPDAGASGGEADHDREEQGHHEEEAALHEVLEEEHRQTAAEPRVLEHPGLHERLVTASDHPKLPTREQVQDGAACEDQPDDR